MFSFVIVLSAQLNNAANTATENMFIIAITFNTKNVEWWKTVRIAHVRKLNLTS